MPKIIKTKHTYDSVKAYIEKQGYRFLLPREEYKNIGSELLIQCAKGHEYTTRWAHFFKRGSRCKRCSVVGIDKVRESFSREGYILISTEYKNQNTKLDYVCPKGHKNKTTWNIFKSGCRCPECVKTDFNDIAEEFSRWGYKILSKKEEYTHNKFKFKFTCPEGHQSSMTWYNFKNGHRCGECAINRKKIFKEVKGIFEKEGYTLLSKEYKNSKSRLKYICPNGHRHSISYTNFVIHNQRCGICSPTKPKTLEEVKGHLESINWKYLDSKYVNCETPFKCKCPKGHEVEKTWDTFKMGQGCPRCSHTVSSAETEIADILESKGLEVVRNSRQIIPPYELDIYIPAKNLAIEYCGLYWHSELSGGKERNYHRRKYEDCLSKGIRLLTIFEDEYLTHKDVVISRALHAAGLSDTKVFARNSSIRRIENSEANSFYCRHHLQGKTLGKYSWGLFYGGELLSCLTLGFLSRGHTKGKLDILELKRMATLPMYSVVGGFGKLFSAAKKFSINNHVEGFKSYCDMRYGNPFHTVYDSLGFELISETRYTPHYVMGERRFRNQSLAKTKEERKTGLTEWELRRSQGYDRIWDCGHRTYLYLL